MVLKEEERDQVMRKWGGSLRWLRPSGRCRWCRGLTGCITASASPTAVHSCNVRLLS